ncbi:response regulator transcription factor [Dysgonomonas sp. HDW5A]|uniref:response regulator transcription factor n=1 Tax=Dysgonomonas sp. HDW5A TaxID=2714926 RepID=UPI00140D1545|nr:response regulator transcription factor [Dysgonomonas sp. HDW5A]QIK59542.1 response regulator transcription factor [Dysgonomonas sp. HDW5A]
MKLLIIEDQTELQNIMKQSLEKENYIIEIASDYVSGMDKCFSYDYDCILLDIMLPDGSGIDLLRELKKNKDKTPIIIISAKDSLEDKVEGLNLGADDYMTKPFHLTELHARIKAAIRRRSQDGTNSIVWNNVELLPSERYVAVDGVELLLNRKEFDLLYYFMTNPNRLINKTSIAEYVWGDYTDQADSLDFIYSQIKNLRKKLKDANAELDLQSVYGIGYKMS